VSRRQGLRRVGDLLAPALPSPERGEVLLPLLQAWPAAVGPAIAREARPSRITVDGAVVVNATSSIWASELTLMAATIAARLGEALGTPAPSLRFQVGPVPQPPAPPQFRPVSAAASARAKEVAADVRDDDLREAIERALARALVRSDEPPDSA
jgi:hypothetical protein